MADPLFPNSPVLGSPDKSITGASLIAQAIRDLGDLSIFTAEDIGSILYPRTAAEIAAGVTPVAYQYPPGNVLRYGADSTGVADSVTAWANAASSSPVIYAPGGTYKFGSKLIITTAGRRFYGDGMKVSIIQSANATFDLIEVRADDMTFEGIGLYGSASDASTTSQGIYTQQAFAPKRLKVFGCYFGGASSSARLNNGIKYDEDCDDGEVTRCIFDEMQGVVGAGINILTGAVDRLKVHHNWFYGATNRGQHSVYLSTGANYCEVTDNFTYNMQLEAYVLSAADPQPANAFNIIARNISVGGNPSGSSTGAIAIFGKSTGNVIEDNTIIQPGQKGIIVTSLLVATDYSALDNIIRDNYVYKAGIQGIDVVGTTRTRVVGNIVYESSQNSSGVSSGIRLVASASGQGVVNARIMGNTSEGSTQNSALELNASSPIPLGTILRGNTFTAGGSGVVNNAAAALIDAGGYLEHSRVTITYSASMVADASLGDEFVITANNGTAFTINSPTNPVDGQRITITIRNTSGGALGVITWSGLFKMSAWTSPATANSRSIDFRYDGTNWVQVSQTGVDVPN